MINKNNLDDLESLIKEELLKNAQPKGNAQVEGGPLNIPDKTLTIKQREFKDRIILVARAKIDIGSFREAADQCSRSIQLEPDNPVNAEVYRWRGIAKIELGVLPGALEDLNKAEELGDVKAYGIIKEMNKGTKQQDKSQ